MTETQTADRAAIADLLSSYWLAADGQDTHGVASLFAEDGVFDGAGLPVLEGRAAIEEFFTTYHQGPHATTAMHFFAPPRIVVDGDGATVACYMLLLAASAEGPPALGGLMRYDDELVRRDGRWLFARRAVAPAGGVA
jgi:uncharacterized protein (TIGR02246 family)